MEQSLQTRVLVTGATGFVGSHLVEMLLRHGYAVTCLVRNPHALKWLKGLNVVPVQGDCSQPESLNPAVRGVSAVYHLAGLTKAKHARDYYRVNHLGTKNILEACALHNPGIKKFVLVSSLAAAGPSPDGKPVADSDIPNPISDYGLSKLRAEEETLKYKNVFPVVILRPAAVYGPRDRDMYELFRWAARGVTIEITGGERYIEMCYVEDLATALLHALEKKTSSGKIYFIGENSYSWTQFRQALLKTGQVTALKVKMPYAAAYLIGLASEFGSLFTSRPALTNRQKIFEASQKYWVCDSKKGEDELGFRYSYPLDKGLEITWQWYRDHNWLR